MPFAKYFNRVYYKQDLEELEQAAHRLNTLIQLQSLRDGRREYVDNHQTLRRQPMTRDCSFELDPKVKRQTDKILRKLLERNSDLRRDGMQELIHQELLELDNFKNRLAERRSRKAYKKGSSRMSNQSTKSTFMSKQTLGSMKTDSSEMRALQPGVTFQNQADVSKVTSADDQTKIVEEPAMPQDQSKDFDVPIDQESLKIIDPEPSQKLEVTPFQVKESTSTVASPPISEKQYSSEHLTDKPIKNEKSRKTKTTSVTCCQLDPSLHNMPTLMTHVYSLHNVHRDLEMQALNPLSDTVQPDGMYLLPNKGNGDSTEIVRSTAGSQAIAPETNVATEVTVSPMISETSPNQSSLMSYPGMPVHDALQAIKQDCSEREIVLLISPLPGESLRESPFLQITALCKPQNRILGSFRIPDDRLNSLEEDGIFRKYAVIFLSTAIGYVEHSIEVIVDHLCRLTLIQTNYEEVNRLFELTETNEYRIYARPDYSSEEPIYVCDFYTASNEYIGTTRLFGADVLRQLRQRPNVVKHFEIVVELNERILPKKIKEIVDLLLSKLNLTKLYEQVGSILFKIFRRLA